MQDFRIQERKQGPLIKSFLSVTLPLMGFNASPTNDENIITNLDVDAESERRLSQAKQAVLLNTVISVFSVNSPSFPFTSLTHLNRILLWASCTKLNAKVFYPILDGLWERQQAKRNCV